jgi:hypothetical protein
MQSQPPIPPGSNVSAFVQHFRLVFDERRPFNETPLFKLNDFHCLSLAETISYQSDDSSAEDEQPSLLHGRQRGSFAGKR